MAGIFKVGPTNVPEDQDKRKASVKVAEKSRKSDYEFEHILDYFNNYPGTPMSLYQWDGSDGAWLTKDREENSVRWRTAVKTIIKEEYEDRFQPFQEVLDFYYTTQIFVEEKGHEIKWIKGATYLIEDLVKGFYLARVANEYAELEEWEFLYSLKDITSWAINNLELQELEHVMGNINLTICDFAVEKFNELLYEDYKDSPRVGKQAYEFDRDFVLLEQRDEALNDYIDADDNYPNALQRIHDFFHGVLPVWLLGIKTTTPVFPQYHFNENYSANLTENNEDIYEDNEGNIPEWTMENRLTAEAPSAPSPDSQYGKEARIQASLLMLYPDSYIDECEYLKNAPLVKNLGKRVRYDQPWPIRTEYIRANNAVMESFEENFVSYKKVKDN